MYINNTIDIINFISLSGSKNPLHGGINFFENGIQLATASLTASIHTSSSAEFFQMNSQNGSFAFEKILSGSNVKQNLIKFQKNTTEDGVKVGIGFNAGDEPIKNFEVRSPTGSEPASIVLRTNEDGIIEIGEETGRIIFARETSSYSAVNVLANGSTAEIYSKVVGISGDVPYGQLIINTNTSAGTVSKDVLHVGMNAGTTTNTPGVTISGSMKIDGANNQLKITNTLGEDIIILGNSVSDNDDGRIIIYDDQANNDSFSQVGGVNIGAAVKTLISGSRHLFSSNSAWNTSLSPTVAMYDTGSGRYYYSDNPSLPSASIDDLTAVDLTLSGDGSPEIFADGDLVLSASGDVIISASSLNVDGFLFASASDANGQPYFNVLYDTSSGQFFYTSSVIGTGEDTDWTIEGTPEYLRNTATDSGVTRKVLITSASYIPSNKKLLTIAGRNTSTTHTSIGGNSESGVLIQNPYSPGTFPDIYSNIDFKLQGLDGRIAFESQNGGSSGDFIFITDAAPGGNRTTLRTKGDGDIVVSGSITASLSQDPSTANPLVSYDESTGGFYKKNIEKNANLIWKATTGNVSSYADLTGSGITLNNGEFYFNTTAINGNYYGVLSYIDRNNITVASNQYWINDNAGAWMYLTETGSGAYKIFQLDPNNNPEKYNVGSDIRYIFNVGHNYTSGTSIESGSFVGGEILHVKLDKNKLANDIVTPSLSIQNLLYGPNGTISQDYNFIDLIVTQSSGGIGNPAGAYTNGDSFNLSDSNHFTFLPAISVTSSLKLGNITSSAAISASGHLFASLSDANGSYNNTVMYDTSTGQFYYTGSYGGSGTTITGTDTHVLFFDGNNNPAGDAGFTYNKTTDSITTITNITASGVVRANQIAVEDKVYHHGDIDTSIRFQTDRVLAQASSLVCFDADVTGNGVSVGHTGQVLNLKGSQIFASSIPDDTSSAGDSIVLIDTSAGAGQYRLYRTASSAIGGGGGTTITGTDSHILYFNGNNNPEGEASFRWDDTNKRLYIGPTTSNEVILSSDSTDHNNMLSLPGVRNFYIGKQVGGKAIGRISGIGGFLSLHPSFNGTNQNAALAYPAVSRLTVVDPAKGRTATIVNTNTESPGHVLVLGHAYPYAGYSQLGVKYIDFVAGSNTSGVGSYVGSIEYHPQTYGNYYVTYIGNAVNPSDRNIKKNIVDTKFGINDLMKFSVKDFNWKKAPAGTTKTTGLIAQEVKEVFPQLVSEHEDKLHLKTTDIVPMLIKAVQDQQKEIEELKQLIKDKLS